MSLELFDAILKKWGFNSQLDVLCEECAELIIASLHLKRAIHNKIFIQRLKNYREELADVKLMIEQMYYFLSTDEKNIVDNIIKNKKERLKERLKK